ncbi:MAG: alpha/beta hydrolase [Parvibaculum sp.]
MTQIPKPTKVLPSTLDPQVKGLLEMLAEAGGTPISQMAPEGARAMYAAMKDAYEVSIGKVEDQVIAGPGGDLPVRLYTPVAAGGGALPALVFFHGGGWVIGDLDTHDALCRTLANESGCKVVAVDYRLAPEHRCPAAAEDAYAAVAWVEEKGSSLGIDVNAIGVAGDSAGGNLAAVVCQMAKAKKGPQIRHQLLIYPVTDTKTDTASYQAFGEGFFLEKQTMDWFIDHYVGPDGDPTDPVVAPLNAEDLSGLPEAYVVTAGHDVLKSEGAAYAERLKEAGVAVTYVDCPGMIHGFFNLQAMVDEARVAVAQAAKAVGKALE